MDGIFWMILVLYHSCLAFSVCLIFSCVYLLRRRSERTANSFLCMCRHMAELTNVGTLTLTLTSVLFPRDCPINYSSGFCLCLSVHRGKIKSLFGCKTGGDNAELNHLQRLSRSCSKSNLDSVTAIGKTIAPISVQKVSLNQQWQIFLEPCWRFNTWLFALLHSSSHYKQWRDGGLQESLGWSYQLILGGWGDYSRGIHSFNTEGPVY